MKDFALVILAAGMGSRYGGLKQIDPIGPNGEMLIEYSIYDALKAGFNKVVFVIKKSIEDGFRENIGSRIEKQCDTTYVFQDLDDIPVGFSVPPERVKPWGTAHAVLSAQKVVDTPFAVINADDYYGRSSYQLIYNHLSKTSNQQGIQNYCMVGFALKNTISEHGYVARGICAVDDNGNLIDVNERIHIEKNNDKIQYLESGIWHDIPMESSVSLNCWGFTPNIFDEMQIQFSQFLTEHAGDLERWEFFIPTVVKNLIQAGKATTKVLKTNEQWFGVTYKKDKPQLKQAIQNLVDKGMYPENLWSQP